MKFRLQKMVCSLLLILPLSLLLTCAQQEDPAKMKIQELLAGGLTAAIPDAIQFDFGKFIHDPPTQFLRSFLPAVVKEQEVKEKLLVDYGYLDLSFADEFHKPIFSEFNYFLGKVLGGLSNLSSTPGIPGITRRP